VFESQKNTLLTITIIAFALLLPGCSDKAEKPLFPSRVLGPPMVGDLLEDWFSKHLHSMDETAIYPFEEEREAHKYRLLILPSFDEPICIHLDLSASPPEIHSKTTDGQGGGDPGVLNSSNRHELSGDQVEKLLAAFDSADFWGQTYWKAPPRKAVLDGTRWVLEGVRLEHYHLVHRHEAEAEEMQSICDMIVSLAGISEEAHSPSGQQLAPIPEEF